MPVKTVDDKVTITIALTAIALALYPEIIWIIISTEKNDVSQFGAVHDFLRFFPSFVRNAMVITYIALASAVLGIIFSIRWNNKVSRTEKIAPISMLVLSILLVLMNLFAMM